MTSESGIVSGSMVRQIHFVYIWVREPPVLSHEQLKFRLIHMTETYGLQYRVRWRRLSGNRLLARFTTFPQAG